MTDTETYRLMVKRISQLLAMIEREKAKGQYEDIVDKKSHYCRLTNLQELLDTNMRTFAMLFNRNYDVFLDSDVEIQ